MEYLNIKNTNEQSSMQQENQSSQQEDPFKNFAEEVVISDSDLPF